MLILVKALKAATSKVITTIINIILFRYLYSLVQIFLSGFWAFLAVIYISPYFKAIAFTVYNRIKAKLLPKSAQIVEIFDKEKLESIELDNDTNQTCISKVKDLFKSSMRSQTQDDIFNYIFTSSLHSSFLSLFTIISVEYVHTKYEYSLAQSILYCVGITFIICFGSSMRYSFILTKEWLEFLDETLNDKKKHSNVSQKTKNILIVYNKNKKAENADNSDFDKSSNEFVCLWISKYDAESRRTSIELKFLSSNYSNNFTDIIEYYISKHMSIQLPQPPVKISKTNKSEAVVASKEEQSQLLNDPLLIPESEVKEVKFETYDLILPDYYDENGLFSNLIKKKGFKKQESWEEFKLFPLVDLSITVYSNNIVNVKKSKKNN